MKTKQNLYSLCLRMSQDECIEHVFIHRVLFLTHKLQDPGRTIDITGLAIPLDQSLVGDTVCFQSLGLQFSQKLSRREGMLILQVHTQQSVVVRDVHGHLEIVQRLPDVLDKSRTHLWHLLGYQVTTASNDEQGLGTGRCPLLPDLVQDLFQIASGYSADTADILIESLDGLVEVLVSLGNIRAVVAGREEEGEMRYGCLWQWTIKGIHPNMRM